MATLRVRDLMSSEVIAVRPDDDLTTLNDLMITHDIRHVPVVDDDAELVGLVSHRDLLRAALIEQSEVPGYLEQAVLERSKVRELMTEAVESTEADADIREAAEVMFENKYGCLPVTEGQRVVGILTEADFVRYVMNGK